MPLGEWWVLPGENIFVSNLEVLNNVPPSLKVSYKKAWRADGLPYSLAGG